MTKLLTSAAFVAALIAAPAAFAATPAPATASSKPAATSAQKSAAHEKKAECVKEWKAQKKHTQSEKEFLKACEKR